MQRRFDHNRAVELGNRVLAQLDPKITAYSKHPALPRQHPGRRHRLLPRIRRPTRRRVDPLVGHPDALVTVEMVHLQRHREFLKKQLIWTGDFSIDCKARTRSSVRKSPTWRRRRRSSRNPTGSSMVKPAWLSHGTNGSESNLPAEGDRTLQADPMMVATSREALHQHALVLTVWKAAWERKECVAPPLAGERRASARPYRSPGRFQRHDLYR